METRILGLAIVAATLATPARAIDIGVNTHRGGTAATNDQVAAVMKQRNLKTSRMDLIGGQDQSAFRDQVQKIRANGGTVEVALQISYQWDNSCNPNLAGVEQDAYNQAAAAVNGVKDIVHDFELLNETQLRPEIMREVPWNSAGTATAPYQGKPCVATLTAVLRGMSRAIRDIRASSGVPLRTILGEVGRDFGFLAFMQQNGVLFDVVGWHVYPHANTASMLTDPWFGTGGPLAQLAKFGKPVHVNEFNCGEIYDAGYENSAGAPVTEACLKAFAKHLKDLRAQTIANIESVHVYELLDEPTKAAPENRFGLMYNLSTPKLHLALASAFAGGALSAAERLAITSRGLLTDAEITAMQQTVASAPPPPTAPVDTQAPLVGMTGPAAGSVFAPGATIWASAVASDNAGVKQVRFTVNGSSCVATSPPFNCQLTLPNRKHWSGNVQAQATDAAGNVASDTVRISTTR
ncbi:Ig-like domain-containing protein [Ramlibacter sp. PS4R-6]|uniref:Ig-like domain-containing protein n=1 Tax=Ramlibacter sp. PS4R-6 TaxID=3133438 RepID=UPI00309849A5